VSLIPAGDLRARTAAGDPDLRICDVRWYLGKPDGGRAAYGAGHIPGAIHLDLNRDLSAPEGPGRHPLPDPAAFAHRMGGLGIGSDHTVVCYDDCGSAPASRLVWMLRTIGQPAAVFDGGLQAWPGPLETGSVTIEPVARSAIPWPPDATVDAGQVATHAGRGLVVDSRSRDRYEGQPHPLDERRGHVPGAVSLPYTGSVDGAGRFLPADELAQRFSDIGADDETAYYCGSGVSACVNALAAEQAGCGRGRLYVASWSGWASDPDRPTTLGDRP